ncbi:MAG: nucleotidyltransferase family protein [Anaerolineales bacterium]
MNPNQLLKTKRAEILRIAARHGARNVRVFGSTARGQARPNSDLDLLVEFEPGRTLLDHIGLIQELEETLGCKVDVVTEQALHRQIRAQVMAQAIAL